MNGKTSGDICSICSLTNCCQHGAFSPAELLPAGVWCQNVTTGDLCVHYQQLAMLLQQSVVLHRQVLRLFLHGLDVAVGLLQSWKSKGSQGSEKSGDTRSPLSSSPSLSSPFLVVSSSSFRAFTSSFRVLFSSCGPAPFFPASGTSIPASRSF